MQKTSIRLSLPSETLDSVRLSAMVANTSVSERAGKLLTQAIAAENLEHRFARREGELALINSPKFKSICDAAHRTPEGQLRYMIERWSELEAAEHKLIAAEARLEERAGPATRTTQKPVTPKKPKYHPALYAGTGTPPKKIIERQEMLDELGDVPESVIMEHINAWRRGDEMLAEMLGNLNQY